MARILVADDEEGIRSFLAESLELDGHDVLQATTGDQAAALLDRSLAGHRFHLLLTDLRMPGLSGMDLVRKARTEHPEMEVIVLTAYSSVEGAVEAMKLGALDYLQKPLSGPAEVRQLAQRAAQRAAERLTRRAGKQVHSETARTNDEPPLSYGATAMRPVVEAIEKVAPTGATVLLLGESGTGKEVAARTLHRLSPRRHGPFVAVNAAALSETLLESELFGHEKGAFTGASHRRQGRLELAAGGTFFLDEIGELKPELQAKLLRVLQERRFERVGGNQPLEADVRWITATNQDLPALMQQGRFREDLYHRLAVFPIRLPPLRERREDILPLARTLLTHVGKQLDRPGLQLDASAERFLQAAEWPGNVRELHNALERAAILTVGDVLDVGCFSALPGLPPFPKPAIAAAPTTVQSIADLVADTPPHGGISGPATAKDRTLEDLEQSAIRHALARVGGHRKAAAKALGIGLRTLYEKLKKYGLG